MGYCLTYRASVKKDLRKIDAKLRTAIVRKILSLADNPRPDGCVKLGGADDVYRVRQGDCRIVYSVHDGLLTIELIRVGHRSDIYRSK